MNDRKLPSILLFALATLLALPVDAQRPERPGGPPREGRGGPRQGERNGPPRDGQRGGRPDGFRPPPNPLTVALDTDGDHELSAEEIAAAAISLMSLDTDGDGLLSRQELRPPRGPGGRGFDGEGPPGSKGERGQGRRRGAGRDFDRRQPGRGPNDGDRGEREGGEFNVDKYVERIMRFDENEDGQVSPDELPDRMRQMVKKCDKDDDAKLSEAELRSAVTAGSPDKR